MPGTLVLPNAVSGPSFAPSAAAGAPHLRCLTAHRERARDSNHSRLARTVTPRRFAESWVTTGPSALAKILLAWRSDRVLRVCHSGIVRTASSGNARRSRKNLRRSASRWARLLRRASARLLLLGLALGSCSWSVIDE